jgi:hypothetical protein
VLHEEGLHLVRKLKSLLHISQYNIE